MTGLDPASAEREDVRDEEPEVSTVNAGNALRRKVQVMNRAVASTFNVPIRRDNPTMVPLEPEEVKGIWLPIAV